MHPSKDRRASGPGRAPSRTSDHVGTASGGNGRARARRVLPTVIGALLAALGLFWALQGAGVVHVRPILCVSECRPVERSDTWLVVGAVTCAVGIAVATRGARPGWWGRDR